MKRVDMNDLVDIADKAVAGEDFAFRNGNGTNFIWGGDLARLYSAVLRSTSSNQVFLGLSRTFIP